MKKPTVEEVAAYVRTRAVKIDPEAFVDFYQSKGWKVGSSAMKDWQAAVRTWEKRQNGHAQRLDRTDPHARGISGAERTRRAREQARLRELAR